MSLSTLARHIKPGDVVINGDGVEREIIRVGTEANTADGARVCLYWSDEKPPIYRLRDDAVRVVRHVVPIHERYDAAIEFIREIAEAPPSDDTDWKPGAAEVWLTTRAIPLKGRS